MNTDFFLHSTVKESVYEHLRWENVLPHRAPICSYVGVFSIPDTKEMLLLIEASMQALCLRAF